MELLNKIYTAGVVGAGGAGFPTHIKLNCQVEYLLINAAECEPLLHTDKYIMERYPKEVLAAVEATAGLVGAKEVYIAVKGVNEKQIACLSQAIDETGSFVKIFRLDNYYPAGDEQMIVYDITGRTVPPGDIPLKVGVAVSNLATMRSVYDAMHDVPVTHKFLTVTGEVNRPAVIHAPIGISFGECVDACGGAKTGAFKVISGGPMMGVVYNSGEWERQVVTKTTSGIILIDARDNFIAQLKDTDVKKILNRAKSACIQCSFCTQLCPRNLIGHNLRPHRIMRSMAMMDFDNATLPENEITKEALICCECGVCEAYACPMNLSPRQVNKYVKRQLAGKRYDGQTETYTASPFRAYRKIAPAKLMMRMGLSSLYHSKVMEFQTIRAAAVTIPLKQHIGAPATPCVQAGDVVEVGQLIAEGRFDRPSANIHASIGGRVIKTDGGAIEIKGAV